MPGQLDADLLEELVRLRVLVRLSVAEHDHDLGVQPPGGDLVVDGGQEASRTGAASGREPAQPQHQAGFQPSFRRSTAYRLIMCTSGVDGRPTSVPRRNASRNSAGPSKAGAST